MVCDCVSAKGLEKLYFIDGTVNTEKYQRILETNLLPSTHELNSGNNFIFRKDATSSHTTITIKNDLKFMKLMY